MEWKGRVPVPHKEEAEDVPFDPYEPLRAECEHFLECVRTRQRPRTDGEEGLAVLEVLAACQGALDGRGPVDSSQGSVVSSQKAVGSRQPVGDSGQESVGSNQLTTDHRPQTTDHGPLTTDHRPPTTGHGPLTTDHGPLTTESNRPYFVHPTAVVDEPCEIGDGSKIWHFCHVLKGAKIGQRCILGQNVNVDGGVVIGNNVKIQNNVSLYTGLVVEDDVFLGPSCVLTNVTNPRSQVVRHSLYEQTTLRKGCTIGANATIVCGVTIGRYAFVGAGAVVTKDVPDYALILGNPGRQHGWMSRMGHRLTPAGPDGSLTCPESGHRYREVAPRRPQEP